MHELQPDCLPDIVASASSAPTRDLVWLSAGEGQGGHLRLIEGAAEATGTEALSRFDMLAYSGGPLLIDYWDAPVYVDVEGMEIRTQSMPSFLQHYRQAIVGHTTSITKSDGNRSVMASMVVSGAGAEAEMVVKTARRGFPWQASITARPLRMEKVSAGASASVNGRTLQGPAYIARQSSLREISIVPLGGDADAIARIAATAAEDPMYLLFKRLLDPVATGGGGSSAVTASASDPVPAAPAAPMPPAAQAAPAAAAPAPSQVQASATDLSIAAHRAAIAAEDERIAGIRRICANHPEISARAVRDGLTLVQAELEVLRASRPVLGAPNINASTPEVNGDILAAAMCVSGALPNRERHFPAPVLEAAERHFRHGIGLQELLITAAAMNGRTFRSFRSDPRGVLEAAFSSAAIGTVLAAIANKFMMEGYRGIENVWRMITKIIPLNDLKTVTRFRLTQDAKYERVTTGGELKHGTLGDEKYTLEPDTFGKIFAITRTHLINDDQGALTDVPFNLGRGGALALNEEFWKAFLDNSAFFATGNSNYKAGATTTLDPEGMRQATELFLKQTDPHGNPLGIMPEILLLPVELAYAGDLLFQSAELRDTTANKLVLTANIYRGRYKPAASAYLSNPNFTGYSAKAWYLLANPLTMPVMEAGFLNGQETPIVEQAEAQFNVLGIEMRGYHDWAVGKANPRGGAKMKGEA